MATRDLVGVLDDGTVPDTTRTPAFVRQPLRITRGTDVTVRMSIVGLNGVPVRLIDDAQVLAVLVVKRRSQQGSPDARVVGTLKPTDGVNRIDFTIAASATKNLQPGRYTYDVVLTFNGKRDFVVPMSAFYLEPSLQPTA